MVWMGRVCCTKVTKHPSTKRSKMICCNLNHHRMFVWLILWMAYFTALEANQSPPPIISMKADEGKTTVALLGTFYTLIWRVSLSGIIPVFHEHIAYNSLLHLFSFWCLSFGCFLSRRLSVGAHWRVQVGWTAWIWQRPNMHWDNPTRRQWPMYLYWR